MPGPTEVIASHHLEAKAKEFIESFNAMSKDVCANAIEKGFWYDAAGNRIEAKDPNVLGNKLMLAVGELSEGHEVLRKHDDFLGVPCPKAVAIGAFEEELADCIIRLMDTAEMLGINLGRAIALKHVYNCTRPYKHGKVF